MSVQFLILFYADISCFANVTEKDLLGQIYADVQYESEEQLW